MKKTISRTEANNIIENFFINIKNKTQKNIKKIKRLAMSHNIQLKEKKKLFCKKCFSPYSGKEKIRIKNKVKSIACKKCNYISRWKIVHN